MRPVLTSLDKSTDHLIYVGEDLTHEYPGVFMIKKISFLRERLNSSNKWSLDWLLVLKYFVGVILNINLPRPVSGCPECLKYVCYCKNVLWIHVVCTRYEHCAPACTPDTKKKTHLGPFVPVIPAVIEDWSRRRKNTSAVWFNNEWTLFTHSGTYFCKEALEELSVLGLMISYIKKVRGGGWEGQGRKMLPTVLQIKSWSLVSPDSTRVCIYRTSGCKGKRF